MSPRRPGEQGMRRAESERGLERVPRSVVGSRATPPTGDTVAERVVIANVGCPSAVVCVSPILFSLTLISCLCVFQRAHMWTLGISQ